MNWNLQLADGTWIESSKLPSAHEEYKTAILMDGLNEVLRLKVINAGEPVWVVS